MSVIPQTVYLYKYFFKKLFKKSKQYYNFESFYVFTSNDNYFVYKMHLFNWYLYIGAHKIKIKQHFHHSSFHNLTSKPFETNSKHKFFIKYTVFSGYIINLNKKK